MRHFIIAQGGVEKCGFDAAHQQEFHPVVHARDEWTYYSTSTFVRSSLCKMKCSGALFKESDFSPIFRSQLFRDASCLKYDLLCEFVAACPKESPAVTVMDSESVGSNCGQLTLLCL